MNNRSEWVMDVIDPLFISDPTYYVERNARGVEVL
jgi:hypothetical protein